MMARPIIRAILALLLTLVYIHTLKGGVQAEKIELETKPDDSLPKEIQQPEWRIAREAKRSNVNSRKNKKAGNRKMKADGKTKKTKTKPHQVKKKLRQRRQKSRKMKTNGRKVKQENRKKSRKNKKNTRKNKKKSRRNKKKSRKGYKKSKKNRKVSRQNKKRSKKNQNKNLSQIKRNRNSTSCDEKALGQKIKDYIKIGNHLRMARRIEKACTTMEKKAKKSENAFEATVGAWDKFLGPCPGRRKYFSRSRWRRASPYKGDVTVIMEKLKNCSKSAKAKCQKSSLEACQNETRMNNCDKELSGWIQKFKESCLQASNDYCPCITKLPDVSKDCLKFDQTVNLVLSRKKKCTSGDELGSFGFCKKLQIQAAEKGPGAANCQNTGIDNTTTGLIITTTRKPPGPSEDDYDKKFMDFKLKASSHFDEIVVNLTSSNSISRQSCPSSSCQSSLLECTPIQFVACQRELFYVLFTCRIEGIVACFQKLLELILGDCQPCICKAIFIHFRIVPAGCKHCDGCPSVCFDNWLVLTGGANNIANNTPTTLQKSSEIITSTGGCQINIPALLAGTAAGRSAWIDGNTLLFCGGSQTFNNVFTNINTWGSTKLCFTTTPTAGSWTNDYDMNTPRSFYTLTAINYGQLVAVGGIGAGGIILNTKSVFSVASKTWSMNEQIGPNGIYGHCTVPYYEGRLSYLIIIGGSATPPSPPTSGQLTALTNVKKMPVGGGTPEDLASLPEPLWGHACSIHNGRIYVSGGSTGDLSKYENQVYRYKIDGGVSWTTLGTLTHARYGHIMNWISGPTGYQLTVAGGFDGSDPDSKSIERSQDGGFTWAATTSGGGLFDGRVFIASTKVRAGAVGIVGACR